MNPFLRWPTAFAGLCAAALLSLGGCADVHWQRALYEGGQFGARQCVLTRRSAAPPCAGLPDYDRYEAERSRARGGASAAQPAPQPAAEVAP